MNKSAMGMYLSWNPLIFWYKLNQLFGTCDVLVQIEPLVHVSLIFGTNRTNYSISPIFWFKLNRFFPCTTMGSRHSHTQ
jgi:hypothetical protein